MFEKVKSKDSYIKLLSKNCPEYYPNWILLLQYATSILYLTF